jgi:pimeloyl-ACP methyl ester carboxylesterase
MPELSGIYYFAHEPEQQEKKRPPVILIHGAGGNHLSWPPQIRRMAEYRVYAPDLPGHGKSEGMGRHSIEEYAEDIVLFMKGLKIGSAVFAGISMGGAIALTLALKYPRKVLGLALFGSGVKLRVAPKTFEDLGNANTLESGVDEVNANCFSENAPQNLVDLSKRAMMETRPSVLIGDFMACNEFDVTEKISTLKKRTLIVCGSEDKMTPPRFSENLHTSIKNSCLQIVEGAGHIVMAEQPDMTAAYLNEFLDSIPLRTRRKPVPPPQAESDPKGF